MANTDDLSGWTLADIPPGAYFADAGKREGHVYVKPGLGPVVAAPLIEVNPLGEDAQAHRLALSTGVSPIERFASTAPVAFPEDGFFKRISVQIATAQRINPSMKREDLPGLGAHDALTALDRARERASIGLMPGEETSAEAKEHRFTYRVWAQAQTEKTEVALALQVETAIKAAAELAARNQRLAMQSAMERQDLVVEKLLEMRNRIEETERRIAEYRAEHPLRSALQDRIGVGAPSLDAMQQDVKRMNMAIDKELKPEFEASVSVVRSLEHQRIREGRERQLAPQLTHADEITIKTSAVKELTLPTPHHNLAVPKMGM